MYERIHRYAQDLASAQPVAACERALHRLLAYYQHVATIPVASLPITGTSPRRGRMPVRLTAAPDLQDRALERTWTRTERSKPAAVPS